MRIRVVGVLVRAVRLGIRGHIAIVRYGADVIVASDDTLRIAGIEIRMADERAARTFAATRTDRDLVVVVDIDIRERRLRERLLHELALLVLQVGVVSCSFLACEGGRTSKTLLVATTNDFRDALVNLVTAVLLQGSLEN